MKKIELPELLDFWIYERNFTFKTKLQGTLAYIQAKTGLRLKFPMRIENLVYSGKRYFSLIYTRNVDVGVYSIKVQILPKLLISKSERYKSIVSREWDGKRIHTKTKIIRRDLEFGWFVTWKEGEGVVWSRPIYPFIEEEHEKA